MATPGISFSETFDAMATHLIYLFLMLFFFGCSASSLPGARLNESVPTASGSVLAPDRGYESLSGRSRGPCLAPGPESDIGSGGSIVTLDLTFLQKPSDLYQDLGAGNLRIFPSFLNREPSPDLIQEAATIYDDELVLARLKVTVTTRKELFSPQITHDAGQVLVQRGTAAFYSLCGDKYIAGAVHGGSLSAYLAIHLASNQSRGSVRDELTALRRWFTGGSQNDISRQLAAFSDVDIQIYVSGVRQPLPDASGDAPLVDLMRTTDAFVRNIEAQGDLASAQTYILTPFADIPMSIPNPAAESLSRLETLAERKLTILTELGQATQASEKLSDHDLSTEALRKKLEDVDRAASICMEHPLAAGTCDFSALLLGAALRL